jgi:hypothetical protein
MARTSTSAPDAARSAPTRRRTRHPRRCLAGDRPGRQGPRCRGPGTADDPLLTIDEVIAELRVSRPLYRWLGWRFGRA